MTEPAALRDAHVRAFAPSSDLARSRAFYAEVLGLEYLGGDDFGIEFDVHGTTLRVAAVGAFTPHPFTVLGWGVPDVGAVCRDLAACGVRMVRFDGMDQDDDGVWTAPSGAKVAWFHDPDGNVLSVDERPAD